MLSTFHYFCRYKTAVCQAHTKFTERKQREAEEMRKLDKIAKEKAAEEARQKELIDEAQKRNESLNKKEVQLQADEQKREEDYAVSTRMLESANKQLKEGLEANDMVAVNVAKNLMESACSKLKEASIHRNEQWKVRTATGSKRKSAFRKLMKAARKKK